VVGSALHSTLPLFLQVLSILEILETGARRQYAFFDRFRLLLLHFSAQ
jgi:hypothetical protein